MKYLKYIVALFSIIPAITYGHVKWFVQESVEPIVSEPATPQYIAMAAVACALAVVVGYHLDTYVTKKFWNKRHWSERVKEIMTSVFGVVVGLYFIIASYSGFVFSMDLNHFGPYLTPLLVAQALVGACYLIGFAVRISSILLIAVWLFGFIVIGPLHMLEAFWVLGAGLFGLIYGRSHFAVKNFIGDRFFKRYEPYALPLIRVITGLDLIVLGFSEKLLHPELALNFLSMYNWNFFNHLGFEWFTDYMFVFLAGTVEVIFGVILVLGIVTRINALIIGVIFTIPIIMLGPVDLIGHMPHFGVVIMLILFGSGDKLTIAKMKRNT